MSNNCIQKIILNKIEYKTHLDKFKLEIVFIYNYINYVKTVVCVLTNLYTI